MFAILSPPGGHVARGTVQMFTACVCSNAKMSLPSNLESCCRVPPKNLLMITSFVCLLVFSFIFRTNVVMNYTEIEGKVREATNDEPWGPTGPLMQELAHATFTYEHFPEAMSMLWKRMLQDNKTNWRRTYKVSAKCGEWNSGMTNKSHTCEICRR